MGDIVAVCIVYYVMPFPILLFFVKRECVHSVDEVPVLERKLMVVSVEVSLWKMLMLRQVGLLVIESLIMFASSWSILPRTVGVSCKVVHLV